MSIIVGSARIDENGHLHGGQAGDQTGNEVSTQPYYNHKTGWRAFRCMDHDARVKIAQAMHSACENQNIGYDQWQRYSLINYVKDAGYNPAKANRPVETDCSALVRVCVAYGTGKDIGDFNTTSEPNALLNSGLFTEVMDFNASTGAGLLQGDILVTKKKGHTVIVTSSDQGAVKAQPTNTTPVRTAKDVIREGQQHSINFTGHKIAVDGSRGPETRRQAVRVIQTALNLDYRSKLKVDGLYGSKTAATFGKHYVEKGEKQYLVTAAEILCMMAGTDPRGVECPGIFGEGLARAAGGTFLDRAWFVKKTK